MRAHVCLHTGLDRDLTFSLEESNLFISCGHRTRCCIHGDQALTHRPNNLYIDINSLVFMSGFSLSPTSSTKKGHRKARMQGMQCLHLHVLSMSTYAFVSKAVCKAQTNGESYKVIKIVKISMGKPMTVLRH